MSSTVPVVEFNNGLHIPMLGFGTWKALPSDIITALKTAIHIGYRHIDGAFFHQNEKEVGQAIRDKIQDGTVKRYTWGVQIIREELFITSKLWNTFHDPNLVEKACKRTLSDLGLDYLDLYLMQYPFGYKESDYLFPMDENEEIAFSDFDYLDTWKAMEQLVINGLVLSIGVSNFNSEQIERILYNSSIKPVANQIECHPYLAQIEFGEWLAKHKIVMMSYNPFGSPQRTKMVPNVVKLLKNPVISAIAEKNDKTPAQILLRYHIDRGFVVISKSVNINHLQENIDIFDFTLDDEDLKRLNDLNIGFRYFPMKRLGDEHKYYPFHVKF